MLLFSHLVNATPSGVTACKLVFICRVLLSLCGYHREGPAVRTDTVSHIKYSIISHYLKASDHLPDMVLLQPLIPIEGTLLLIKAI